QSKLVKYFSRQLSCKRKVALQERNAKLEGFPQLLHWFRIVDIRKEVMEEIAPGQLSLEELLDMTDDQVCATVEKFGANSEECARLNASLSCLRSVHKSGGSLSKQDWTIQWPTTEPGKENSPGCQPEPGQWGRTHLSQSPKVQPKCGQHHCHGGSPHGPMYTHVDRLTVEGHPGLCPPVESGHRSLPPSPRQRHIAHTPPRTPNIVTTMTPPGTPPVRRRNKLKPPGTPPPSSRKLIHLIPGFTALHRSKSHEFQLGHRVDEAHTPNWWPSLQKERSSQGNPTQDLVCTRRGKTPCLSSGAHKPKLCVRPLHAGVLLNTFLQHPAEKLFLLPGSKTRAMEHPLVHGVMSSDLSKPFSCPWRAHHGWFNVVSSAVPLPSLQRPAGCISPVLFISSIAPTLAFGAALDVSLVGHFSWIPVLALPLGFMAKDFAVKAPTFSPGKQPVLEHLGVAPAGTALTSSSLLSFPMSYRTTSQCPTSQTPAATPPPPPPPHPPRRPHRCHPAQHLRPPCTPPRSARANRSSMEEVQESEDDFEEMNLSLLSARNFPRKASQTSIFLQEWDIPFEQLEIGELIGKGRFGQVFHGRWHGEVAIRLIDIERDNEDQLKAFKREVMAYRQTRHENVVLFMGACMSPPHLAIITSLCKGRTLYSVVRDAKIVLDVNKTRQIAQEIVKGMGYLHAKGILHKDLKSKNVFYDNGKVVITDFGLFSISGVLQAGRRENKLRIQNGWLCHLAPEIIRQLSPDTEEDKLPFSKHSDVFALGTIWYELHAREWPFKTQPAEAIIWQVGRGMKPNLSQIGMGKEISDILLFCWAYEQEERPTFTKLMDMLEKLPKRNRRLSHPGHFWKSAE
ncbi:KSR2 Kinase, partial [Uria aalge]|nr:KSR2 Kinase [Uria aalge]